MGLTVCKESIIKAKETITVNYVTPTGHIQGLSEIIFNHYPNSKKEYEKYLKRELMKRGTTNNVIGHTLFTHENKYPHIPDNDPSSIHLSLEVTNIPQGDKIIANIFALTEIKRGTKITSKVQEEALKVGLQKVQAVAEKFNYTIALTTPPTMKQEEFLKSFIKPIFSGLEDRVVLYVSKVKHRSSTNSRTKIFKGLLGG